MRNYYEILGVPEEAGHYEIKAAFKKLAMQYHPDKHAGDPAMEERFKEINMAYQVLSDPIQKANYDYRFKYSVPTYEYTPPTQTYETRRPPYARKGKKTTYSYEDLKRNNKGTLWAFGLSLALATVIMAAMQAYAFYQNLKMEALLDERRSIFDTAVKEAELGHVDESLKILSPFVSFYKTEDYIKEFKEELLTRVIHDGDVFFEKAEYVSALENYLIAEPYLVYRSFDFKLRMAQCYKETDQFNEAITTYKDLLQSGLQKRHILKSMADIYRDDLLDYEASLNYYHQAADVVINSYISSFGEAYIILIHSGNVGREDLDIFLGEARGYLLVGNVEQSLHETKWLANVWPKAQEIYLLRADCYQAVGDEKVACQYKDLAARISPLPEGVVACH
ncbi:DnaJ domain-containing protein [Imperialibacter roseus]|uniref:DnaJ domain-containing protein n=1 Tax=Imperialibacter roseus TaxID=1324217 RepID=A0ABZ0IV98_9BACT|nr:DnaJ domain-containing protein [Imperialibacter roseus]WOK08069.1 DnaJ domain-containing protein [Imperialibacter roseus]